MIIKLEEMCMNAWPALKTLLYDGWVMRFANAYSRRSNSVNAVYPCKEDMEVKIQNVENIYKANKQKSIFKITPKVYPENLDNVLESKGYALEALTSVQTMEIGELKNLRVNDGIFECELSEEWLQSYCELNNVPLKDRETVAEILKGIVPNRYFVTLKLEDCTVACGLGVMENEYVGLFDIVVHKDYRGKGLGEQLLLNILKKAKVEGAATAYLQVMCNNPSALRLYEKLGFKEVYKYWYRVKEV